MIIHSQAATAKKSKNNMRGSPNQYEDQSFNQSKQ